VLAGMEYGITICESPLLKTTTKIDLKMDPFGIGKLLHPNLLLGIPQNWPEKVRYIKHCIKDLAEVCSSEELVPLRRDSICIKQLPRGHPAFKENGRALGIFATKLIPCETVIGQYVGMMKHLSEPHSTSYSFRQNLESDYVVDAKFAGNETRLMNDYRGIGYQNVKFENGTVIAIEDIEKGEELLLDYGSSYWRSRQHLLYDDIHHVWE